MPKPTGWRSRRCDDREDRSSPPSAHLLLFPYGNILLWNRWPSTSLVRRGDVLHQLGVGAGVLLGMYLRTQPFLTGVRLRAKLHVSKSFESLEAGWRHGIAQQVRSHCCSRAKQPASRSRVSRRRWRPRTRSRIRRPLPCPRTPDIRSQRWRNLILTQHCNCSPIARNTSQERMGRRSLCGVTAKKTCCAGPAQVRTYRGWGRCCRLNLDSRARACAPDSRCAATMRLAMRV